MAVLDFIINYFQSGKVLFPITGISSVLQIYTGLEFFENTDEKRQQKRQVGVQEAAEGAQGCLLLSLCFEESLY